MENWEQINAVQRMQNYIKTHLEEAITLKELANEAGYSPYHCSRIFKEQTGKNPFDYIRDMRLSQAALKLRDSQSKVSDVAFDFVFDTHEGFTRAFSKKFGLNPGAYQKNTPPIQLFLPSPIRDYYAFLNRKGERQMKRETSPIFTQVVERPERCLLLKRGNKSTDYFAYCEEVGCDVWGILTSVKEAIYEPVGMWLPESLRKPGTSVYCQGVEVPADYSGEIPAGFDLIKLPPCKMMIFQGQPYDDENFCDAIDELWDAIEKYDPKLYGFEWAPEDAPRIQLMPMGYRGYIEGRPVKELK